MSLGHRYWKDETLFHLDNDEDYKTISEEKKQYIAEIVADKIINCDYIWERIIEVLKEEIEETILEDNKKMLYKDIRHLLIANDLTCSIDLDIASCVSSCVGLDIDDETFTLLCSYVRHIWDNVEKSYTQLIADVVCDCYLAGELTKKDLEKHNKTDEIIDLYYDRYNS